MIIRFKGGLGNQMFQFALGTSLENHYGKRCYYDYRYLECRNPRENFVFRKYNLDIFGIHARKVTSIQYHIINKFANIKIPIRLKRILSQRFFFHVLHDKSMRFNPQIHNLKSNNYYLDGYWQSYMYFQKSEKLIRSLFDPKKIRISNSGLDDLIINKNSVCINVRRADFVNISSTSDFLGFVGAEFYKNALNYLNKHIKNPFFFIFSDDLEWCRDFFDFLPNSYLVDHTFAGTSFSNYFRLMTLCRHFIIPNSTFAWWAAWLSPNSNKLVIAPQNWFKGASDDLIPPQWVRI
jgi:hypothetical protein